MLSFMQKKTDRKGDFRFPLLLRTVRTLTVFFQSGAPGKGRAALKCLNSVTLSGLTEKPPATPLPRRLNPKGPHVRPLLPARSTSPETVTASAMEQS